jgi:hypothetical protein
MAGPHVVGLIALAISAQGCFDGDVDALEQYVKAHVIAKTTTQTCGGVPGSGVPNNTYGYGAIRAAFPVAGECGAFIGAAASGVTAGTAKCTNRTTGQNVTAPVDAATSFNCEAAGLLTSAGDAVTLRLNAAAQVDLVQGTTTGMRSLTAQCKNLTTGQSKSVQLHGRDNWNCKAAGLAISPGDTIQQILSGTAD